MQPESACSTRFLADEPTSSDRLGPHARIARVLLSLIQGERKGLAICLEGPWGSGKSSVVRIIRQFAEGSRTEVFVFDAWTHQGDPLRRVFIERFADFLGEAGLVQKEAFRTELDKLAKRQDTTSTYSRTRVWPGAFIATGLLLAGSVGMALVDTKFRPRWLVWGLILLPLALLSVGALLAALRVRRGDDDRLDGIPYGQAGAEGKPSMFAALTALTSQRASDETHTSSVRDVEPTSLEFETLFAKLCRAALGQDEETRLLIVMDNLDRVDPADAVQLWSTMKTFAELPQRDPPLSGLWLLVPFDPDGLARLWNRRPPSIEVSDRDGPDGNDVQPSGGYESLSLADAFLEKTFQVRMTLPAPVLSAWRDFLVAELLEALPEHSEDERNDVYQVFRAVPRNRPPAVTPRSVRLFVNRLAGLHKQWEDQIPLVVQALYARIGSQIGPDGQEILLEDLVDPRLAPLVKAAGGEWRGQLAGLHFNIPLDRAIQIVLRPALLKSLAAADTEELNRLLNTSAQASDVLWNLIEDGRTDWPPTEADLVALSSKVLQEAEEAGMQVPERAWHSLGRAVNAVTQWPAMSRDIGQGLATIAERSPTVSANGLAESFAASGPLSESQEDVANWALQWIEGVAELAAERVFSKECQVVVPGRSAGFVGVMNALGTADFARPQTRVVLKGPEDTAGVVASVVASIEAGEYSGIYPAVDQIIAGNLVSDWNEIFSAVQARFTAAANLPVAEAHRHVLTLFRLRGRETQASEVLGDLCRRGDVLHYLWQSSQERQVAVSGLLALAMLLYCPQCDCSDLPGNAPDGQNRFWQLVDDPRADEAVLRELSSACKRYAKSGDLSALGASGQRHRSLVEAILSVVETLDGGAKWIGREFFVDSYELVEAALDDDGLNRAVTTLDVDGQLSVRCAERDFSPGLVDLYTRIVTEGDAVRDPLADRIRNGLSDFSKDEWVANVDGSTFFDLGVAASEKGVALDLGPAFADALLEEVNRALNDVNYETWEETTWSVLPRCLSEDARVTFLRNARDRLLVTDAGGAARTFQLLGEQLADSGVLAEKADDLVRQLGGSAVERGDAQLVDALVHLIEAKPQIVERAHDSSLKDLQARAKTRAADESDESALAASLARLVAILAAAKKERPKGG